MTEAEALARIGMLTQATVYPTLTTDELTYLVSIAKSVDSTGHVPSDTDWVPTWDIPHAVAEGWELKAGHAAIAFDFEADKKKFARSQIYGACKSMAARWKSKSSCSVALVSSGLPAAGSAAALEVVSNASIDYYEDE